MGILKNVILTDRVVEGEDKTVRERWEERERERERPSLFPPTHSWDNTHRELVYPSTCPANQ